MHSSVTGIPPFTLANSVITQRLAILSKTTVGSPKPKFSQAPPKFCQIDSMLFGPRIEFPVACCVARCLLSEHQPVQLIRHGISRSPPFRLRPHENARWYASHLH